MEKLKWKEILMGLLLVGGCNLILQAQDHPKKGPKKPPTFEELQKKMDTNKDGKLAKSEVKGPLLKDFDKIDLNKDGYLTKEELNKAPKRKGGRIPWMQLL